MVLDRDAVSRNAIGQRLSIDACDLVFRQPECGRRVRRAHPVQPDLAKATDVHVAAGRTEKVGQEFAQRDRRAKRDRSAHRGFLLAIERVERVEAHFGKPPIQRPIEQHPRDAADRLDVTRPLDRLDPRHEPVHAREAVHLVGIGGRSIERFATAVYRDDRCRQVAELDVRSRRVPRDCIAARRRRSGRQRLEAALYLDDLARDENPAETHGADRVDFAARKLPNAQIEKRRLVAETAADHHRLGSILQSLAAGRAASARIDLAL